MQMLPPAVAGAVAHTMTARGVLFQQATRAKARSNFTYLAFLCDVLAVQKALPQVLVIRNDQLSEANRKVLVANLPPNVIVIRRKKSWADAVLLQQIARLLRACLTPWLPTHQPLLLMDAASIHIQEETLQDSKCLFQRYAAWSSIIQGF